LEKTKTVPVQNAKNPTNPSATLAQVSVIGSQLLYVIPDDAAPETSIKPKIISNEAGASISRVKASVIVFHMRLNLHAG
jgi:hypothetical protein